MTEPRYYLGLTNAFTSRIRQYLLLLEVTNHTELTCILADFLTTEELLMLLSTSKHFMSLQKVQAIEIRILRSKLVFYQKPKVHPSPGLYFFGNLPALPTHSQVHEVKSEKLKKEHQALKRFNKKIRLMKEFKLANRLENKPQFQKRQPQKGQIKGVDLQRRSLPVEVNSKAKSYDLNTTNVVIVPSKVQQPDLKINNNDSIMIKREIKVEQVKERQRREYNPLLKRFQEIQYQLAREDYQRRKAKRILEKNQKQLMTLEELKVMAEKDPCSREVYMGIYAHEKARIQRENASTLRMKSFRSQPIAETKMFATQPVQKIAVVKQSIAGKLFSGLRSLIWSEKKTISI